VNRIRAEGKHTLHDNRVSIFQAAVSVTAIQNTNSTPIRYDQKQELFSIFMNRSLIHQTILPPIDAI
jgi:hypothetical protein